MGLDIKIEMYDALLYAHIFATKKLKFDYFTVAFCRVLQKNVLKCMLISSFERNCGGASVGE